MKEGEVVLSVICPVRDWENQQLLGVLGIDIKVSSLEDVIKRNELKYAEKMVIIDSRGIVLSHENKDYLLKNYEVLEHPEVIKRILEKREEDLYTYQSGENEKRIGSVLESKNTGWLVMSSASEGRLKLRLWEIFQPIFLIFFISVLAAMFYEYRMLMKSALFVQSLNEDIRQASFGIQERDQQIVETMKYARLLQKKQGFGIEAAEGVFKDSAILSRTIQKVGGDFVWSKKVKNGVLIAFGDSSGYGIPGALLSVMTMSFLDTAVDTLQEPDLREILWKLEIDLSNRENDQLLAEKPELPLSASLALVYISQEGTIRFAGANCDLFREKDGMTEMVKGEAFDIGEGKAMGPESFQVSFLSRKKAYPAIWRQMDFSGRRVVTSDSLWDIIG